VQLLFVFRAPQGSSTSNLPILTSRWGEIRTDPQKTRRDLNPLCLPLLKEGLLSDCVRSLSSRQREGPGYLYHVLGETQFPVSIFFSPWKRESGESSRVTVVLLFASGTAHHVGGGVMHRSVGLQLDPFLRGEIVDHLFPFRNYISGSINGGANTPFPTRLQIFRSKAMIRLSFCVTEGGARVRNRSTPTAESEVFEHTISAETTWSRCR